VYDPNLGQDVILSDTPLSKVRFIYFKINIFSGYFSFSLLSTDFIFNQKRRIRSKNIVEYLLLFPNTKIRL
jgi:hypothetical protein